VKIDMHMHVDELPGLGWFMTAGDCVASMDEAGIDAAIVMTITDLPEVNDRALELIAEACAAHPGRLYGFARIHPWYGDEAVATLDRAVTEFDFRGLKLHPVSTLSHPGSAESVRLIRRAAELGVPTLFHCGDDPMTTPTAIAGAAAAVPEATIILGHMGGYAHTEEAIRMAERYPNLILETSACPYPDKIREAVTRIGSHRVIFGSDGPVASPALEVDKIDLCRLGADERRDLMGPTAADLIGLS
jgi:predicted TIM-barrel fold metal-dependent hydrolase